MLLLCHYVEACSYVVMFMSLCRKCEPRRAITNKTTAPYNIDGQPKTKQNVLPALGIHYSEKFNSITLHSYIEVFTKTGQEKELTCLIMSVTGVK